MCGAHIDHTIMRAGRKRALEKGPIDIMRSMRGRGLRNRSGEPTGPEKAEDPAAKFAQRFPRRRAPRLLRPITVNLPHPAKAAHSETRRSLNRDRPSRGADKGGRDSRVNAIDATEAAPQIALLPDLTNPSVGKAEAAPQRGRKNPMIGRPIQIHPSPNCLC